jgi:hypothetical protein
VPLRVGTAGDDPKEPCNGTLIDHEVGNVEGAQHFVTARASNFVGCADLTGVVDKGRKARRRTTLRHAGASFSGVRVMMASTVGEPSPVFLPKSHS